MNPEILQGLAELKQKIEAVYDSCCLISVDIEDSYDPFMMDDSLDIENDYTDKILAIGERIKDAETEMNAGCGNLWAAMNYLGDVLEACEYDEY